MGYTWKIGEAPFEYPPKAIMIFLDKFEDARIDYESHNTSLQNPD